ncbi:MAG TPA: hypothetical protein VFE55_13250 [Acidimicrobiia bacterium]|nr:hypothetical protein [Acidimicrobiia bacterium]
MFWLIAGTANFALLVGYSAIFLAMTVPFIRSRQLFANRLGLATALVFLSCALHHGFHAARILWPHLAAGVRVGGALRSTWSWPAVVWDLVTAAAAVYYWSIRRSFPDLFRSAALFEDLEAERRRALEINDNIVQGLAVAQLALALNEREKSEQAIMAALRSARSIISDLLGPSGTRGRLGPGDLVRDEAAMVGSRGGAPPVGPGG